MRIDKFLWCVRLTASRSVATDRCGSGHVRINEREVKASTEVKPGDLISIRQAPIWRVFEVLSVPTSRVGAKLVGELLAERTPWEELEKQEIARKVRSAHREPGAGRPTKRDRRDLERFSGE